MIRFGLCRACRAWVLMTLSFVSAAALAQGADDRTGQPAAARSAPSATSAPSDEPPAQVVVNHRVITVMRGELLGYSPAARAKSATVRILDALKKEKRGKVEIQEAPEGRGFTLDGEFAFFLTPHDVNRLAGESLDSIAERAARMLELVAREHAEQRDPMAFTLAVIFSALATLVFAGAIQLIRVANRRLRSQISATLAARAQKVKIAGVHAIDFGSFLRGMRHLIVGLSWALAALVTYVWLVFVFERFPYTRSWGEKLGEQFLQTIKGVLTAIVEAIPDLITVVIIYFIARWLTQLSSAFFSRVEFGRVSVGWLDRDTAAPTRRIINVVIWLFALAMAYPYLPGSGTDAFKGLSVLVGLMISIGASNLVGQAASGLILMYTRSFRPGELVRIGDTEGTVSDLGLFSTRVRTAVGEEVMLPNSLVLSQSSRNYSRASEASGFVVSTTVTIGYSTPWRQVHAMLLEAARRTDGILADPAPKVIQAALSDFFVEYRMTCHAHKQSASNRTEMLSQLYANIQDVFNEYDVQIMSPHYVSDPPETQVVPPAKWYSPPAVPPAKDAKAE